MVGNLAAVKNNTFGRFVVVNQTTLFRILMITTLIPRFIKINDFKIIATSCTKPSIREIAASLVPNIYRCFVIGHVSLSYERAGLESFYLFL